jgi:hypothetical protein
MAVENKSASGRRDTLIIAAIGLFGLVAGALGGYVGYSFAVIGKSPLTNLRGRSNESPFEETYRGMARLGGLERSAGRCDGKPVPSGTIEREKQVIEQIEASSRKINLNPPLNVARAIVAYRAATMANMHSDQQAFGSSIQQETAFLQAAGWKDTSSGHFARIVRALDDCPLKGIVPKEKQ